MVLILSADFPEYAIAKMNDPNQGKK